MTNNPGVLRLAPHNPEAEEASIGGVLTDPSLYLDIAAYLHADDFHINRLALIWEAIGRVAEREEAIDVVTVSNEIAAMGKAGDFDGKVRGYLINLINRTPTSLNTDSYARLVQRLAVRRRMLTAADEIKTLAYDEQLPVTDIVVDAYMRLDVVADRLRDRNQFMPGMASITHYTELLRSLRDRYARGELVAYPLPEMWDRLSECVPQIYPGHFHIVTGDKGSGKSALLETWAEWLAKIGLRVWYCHTEMTTADMLHRRAARHSGLPFDQLAGGQISEDHAAMLKADDAIAGWVGNIDYHYMPDVPFKNLAHEMRRQHARGVNVFVIDHFQDIKPPLAAGTNDTRVLEDMVVWLSAFAEMRNVVVIVASQINAQGKTKWTTKLEEKTVLWLHVKRERLNGEWAYMYQDVEHRAFAGQESPIAKVEVRKARFGRKASIKMLYHGARFLWLDMSRIQSRQVRAEGKVIWIGDSDLRQEAAQP